MAYDKLVDSASLEADLTTVANAIRSKGGTSASLAFPAGFASAIAAIETGGKVTMEKHELTFASDVVGSAKTKTILTGNAFIKEHYAKSGFFIIFRAKSISSKIGYGAWILYHGNRQLLSGISNTNGMYGLLNSGASGTSSGFVGGAVNGSTYHFGGRATSAGNLNLYMPANRNIGAGTYELFLVCEE